ncbi:hypothetical protein VTP01DRAFT_598 [Rhizomucor pusillus]|uniref:uncharacterized protein n=1 Tax=Rhizomucor pusillus TaxID=4840 RepID=UPI00374413BD
MKTTRASTLHLSWGFPLSDPRKRSRSWIQREPHSCGSPILPFLFYRSLTEGTPEAHIRWVFFHRTVKARM